MIYHSDIYTSIEKSRCHLYGENCMILIS